MDHQGFGIADIRQQAEELERVNKLLAGVVAAANTEGDNGAGSVRADIFLRARCTCCWPDRDS